MLQVAIYDSEIKKLEGVSKKTGNEYSFAVQEAYIFLLNPKTGKQQRHPQKIELMLDDENSGYVPGHYQLAPESIQISKEGRFVINPILKAVQSAGKTPA